ncbi:hypothetical protein K432DRAFT_326805 [Lepidopterella palustris CBS 459.81]|uniref:Leucine rich repeat protein n=1 Tax=Lepidopterella palustris CBS 459.81 TaxID=1314670 RepID=A0A8E2JFY2_9PEZI|nr:hypothetical protein K432DRAFT_326805 [Lepidopterella palustris CBS 459.81]
MAKLNYTNRKSEGVKLGEIVAKDLRKRTVSFFSKRESQRETSSLELTLPGKNLTDGGFQEAASGLEDVLASQDGVSCSRLEELNLSNNSLTTKSLPLLARIVRLAAYDLKDLNLSGNHITVVTNEEAQDWETFLDSFKGCRVLRKIDLSDNDLSGPRAFEIFTRVYSKHPEVDPTELNSGLASDSEQNDGNSDASSVTRRISRLDVSGMSNTSRVSFSEFDLSKPRILMRRSGLRAVPYLIFNNCSMTDSGALHLSYILAQHYYPQQLMSHLKPGPIATQLDEMHHRTHCWGLVYAPNDNLTEAGSKLLGLIEESRKELNDSFATPDDVSERSKDWLIVDARQSTPVQRRRSGGMQSLKHRSSALSTDSRKDSALSEGKRVVSSDIESLRKKFQRNAIEKRERVDLWTAAVRMLVYSRYFFLRMRTEETSSGGQIKSTPKSRHSYSPTMLPSPPEESEPLYPITMAYKAPASPSVPIYSNTPHANGTNGYRSVVQNKIDIAMDRARQKIMPPNMERIERDNRNARNPGSLSNELWRRIIVQAAGAGGILTSEQQKKVIHWAGDSTELRTTAKEMKGKGLAVRIWCVLEKMDCLAYDMKI